MYRRIPLLPSAPMTRLVAASALMGAGAVTWAFWPQGQPDPVGLPVAAGASVAAPTADVAAGAPAIAATAERPAEPVTPRHALPAPTAVIMPLEDDEPVAVPPPADEAGPEGTPRGETLYLTIVGDQTFIRRGVVGERVDPGTGWSSLQPGTESLAAALSGAAPAPEPAWTPGPAGAAAIPATPRNASPPPGSSDRGRLNTGQPGSNDPDAGGIPTNNEEPWIDSRPWPQPGCPWTLGPEAGQSMADQLRDLYGCRYLSSCQVQTGQCTWHYQGGA